MSLKMANRIREFFRSMEFLDALPWHAVGQADAGVVPVPRVDRECAIARKPRVRGLPQTQKKIGPISAFPGGVGIDEKEIGNDGTKSTEHGDECGLADLFAQTNGERAGRDPIATRLHF